MAGRPTQNKLSKLITDKFKMPMRDYAQMRGISYNSLRMFVSGIYTDNKSIQKVLREDGILDEVTESK